MSDQIAIDEPPLSDKGMLRRLRSDFAFYAPRVLRIRTKKGAIERFRMNPAQRVIHNALEEQLKRIGKVRAMILKGRQQGASTYVGGRFYHRTSGEVGKRTFILTHEDKATANLFEMVKRYHEHCPKVLQPVTGQDSAKELSFPQIDSKYTVATAGARATGRSATAQFFHGSEMAFWPDALNHLAGIGQTIPDEPGTEVIFESTANGIGNAFHTKWTSAIEGDGEYIAIFVPWFLQPEYSKPAPAGFVLDAEEAEYAATFDLSADQMYWRRCKVVDDFAGDASLFDQEYPATPTLAFMRGADKGLIGVLMVVESRKRKPMFDRGPKILGVDPAEYGEDKTAIAFRQGRKVHWVERHSKKGTMQVAGIVARWIDEVEPDAVCVDVTGVGTGVADRLIELGYPMIYRVHFGEKAYDADKYVNRRAECWGDMNDWFKDKPNLVPDDNQLQSDLCSVQYHYDSSRRMVLMSKEKMKQLGLPSPDSGDAVALTFAERIVVREKTKSWRDRLSRAKGVGTTAQAA